MIVLLKIFALQLSLLFAADHASVPNQYLVKFKSQFTNLTIQNVKDTLGATEAEKLPSIERWYRITTSNNLSGLKLNSNIEFIEPNYYQYANKTPTDAKYSSQWGMRNTGQKDSDGNKGTAGVDIEIESVWDLTVGSPNVIVAVIDTGIDFKHPDLADNQFINEKEASGKKGIDDDGNGYVDDVSGYNFYSNKPNATDDHGHGSHCAGVIGARGNNDFGIAGVNWNVKMMPLKFLSASGSGDTEGAIKSITYAVNNGAKVLSNSWGGGGESRALKEAIEYALSKDVLFVAAAGNNTENTDQDPHFPSSYDVENIISVAALSNSGNLADFSNYGVKTVDLAAPGVNIMSTILGGTFEEWSGTSMATPFVAGVAALMLSVNPNLSALALKAKILATVRPMNSLQGKVLTGGFLNANGAVRASFY
ncbi:MAG: hypothetical protein A4S09_16490 [Proteobacteria bacterium SG_bin7]|nr:MAG: hypothetical protein A4S09_16490 [Proteobacteria bacterium SG_bin7]